MISLGKVVAGKTIDIPFSTSLGSGERGDPSSAFEAADFRVYKRGGTTTQRASEAGYSIASTFDSMVGQHLLTIDLADNTDAGFYEVGVRYYVVLYPDETVDSLNVAGWLAEFEIVPPETAVEGLAQAGAAGSVTLPAAASTTNDLYNGGTAYIARGTGAGQSRQISDYVGSSRVASVDPDWLTTPSTDSYVMVIPSPPNPTSVLPAVTVTTNNDKSGYALSSLGIQAIWDALTSALSTVGSIGKLLVDNVDAAIASRSSHSAADVATAVWAAGARTLTSFGTLVADTAAAVWGAVTRTLTAGTNLPTAADIADAVWEEQIADHSGTAGSTAEALEDAGGAGTPPTVGEIADEVQTRTIAAVTTVATVTNGVTLADNAITAAKFDEATAFPLASADAGATAVARTGADADTLETLSDEIATRASQAGLDDVPTNAELTAALGTADDATLAAISGLASTLATILGHVDTEVAAILALATAIDGKTTNLPSDPADQSALEALLAAVQAAADAIKTKTDQLTFTLANRVDANMRANNDVPVQGTGVLGDEWRPA